ncbi:nonsense-mediated mRNA decay protein 2-like [Manihot esculenta]|uniref:nonsense-mediated mRNA decay protein 2-like n=1 Tax=Manihot esculenta TaxID=3983 RepID=UPI000B5D6AA0|nr:nonsense-mediated mRNA decay protein 2-like [Manihot esculenta]
MAVPAYANIHWDGNIINSCNDYDYDGGFSKIIPMGKRISFNQLVGKITHAIGLSENNEFIETISFRKSTIVDGSLKFECMEIWGEDDVSSMLNYLYQIGGIPGIEIYIKILHCVYTTNEDADIGPSRTAMESNDEPCEEQNVVDDYGLCDSLAGPSINLSDTIENENEEKDEDEDEDDNDDDSWMSTEDDEDDNEIDFNLLRVDPYDKPEDRSFWDPSKEFSVGMIFSSRDAVAAAAKEYNLRYHHQFCYHETREMTYSIKCKDKNSGCAWRLRASKKEEEDIWKMTRYSGPHTCTNPQLTKNHNQLDENFICSFIFALIE